MADTFKPYQGGIAPIQGISEAGARIGSMTQEGLMSFGKSLAEGIKGYQDNTQKRQVVDEQSKALGMQLQRYHQMFSQTDEQGNLINPEYAGLAEGLKSQIESLSKVPSLSLGSALGAVNAAQAAFQGLDKEIAVNEMMRKASLEKGIYTAEQGAPDKEKYDVAALMQSGKWGYNPNESYAKNETNLREAIRTAKAADPTVKGDENEAVAKWRNQVQGLAAGIQDEQQKAIIIDELEAARQLERRQKEVVSEFEKSGLAAGVMKFAGMYGEDLTRDMSLTTETTQALLDAKNKPAETKSVKVETLSPAEKQQYQAKADAALERFNKEGGNNNDYREYLINLYKANPEKLEQDKQSLDSYSTGKQDIMEEVFKLFEPKAQYDAKAEEAWTRHKKNQDTDSYVEYLVYRYKANPDRIKSDEEAFNAYPEQAQKLRQKALKIIEREKGVQKALLDAKNKTSSITPELVTQVENENEQRDIEKQKVVSERIARLEKLRTEIASPSVTTGDVIDKKLKVALDTVIGEIYSSNVIGFHRTLNPMDLANAIASNFAITQESARKINENAADIGEVLKGAMAGRSPNELLNEKPISAKGRVNALKVVDEKINNLKTELQALQKTPEQKRQEAQQFVTGSTEPAKPLGTLVGTENLQFGTKEETRDIPIAQKRAQVAEYFKTKFGYVPSGFNEVYAKIHPESVLQTTQVNGTTLLWDGQKWTQMQGEKQLTVDEKLKMRERQFGALDKEGKPVKTEIIPNSGIYAYGTFNSSSAKRVGDFRQFTADYSQVQIALDKLEALNKKWGGSLSPEARKEADQYKARIRALLKMEVANTGSVSDFEQRRIDDVTPAVNDLFSLSGANQRSIDVLREKLKANLTSTGAAFGVDIEIRTGANSKEAVIKQAKLNRYRNQQ